MGCEVYPAGLSDLLERLAATMTYPCSDRDGAAYPDVLSSGTAHDEARVRYLEGHLRAVQTALQTVWMCAATLPGA
jgi:beta-glucosidase